MRIGIIGAGPAGLTAAEILRRRGQGDITVLEKNRQAGGKCSSFQYEGRTYELGAGILSGNNHIALELAQKYGVETRSVDFSPSLFLSAETGQPLAKPSLMEQIKLAYQVWFRYRRLCQKYQRVAAPGLDRVPAELAEPFSAWAAKQGIALVAQEFTPFFTGYGYGFFEEISAAYVLKYYSWNFLKAFLKKQIYKFPGGIQELWTRVARAHRVVYNTTIKSISRGQTVIVKTDQQDFHFDKLILASPLDEALSYLDASAEERDLFSKIRYYDYRTYACVVKGWLKRSGYIPGNHCATRQGHPVFWHQRYPDSDLYTFYIFGSPEITDDQAEKNIAQLVRPLGGRVERRHRAAHWKFFPHVSPDDLRAGYFDRLEAEQGRRHTYYAGELLNFSTVGLSADYSKKLIERFF